jgi:ABC-type transporter Mla subunit MlaD
MSSMTEASDKIKKASDSFVSMNGTLETSATRNKEAAAAQHEAAKVNQEVATKFGAVSDRLPEVRQTIEDAARVIGSLGGPLAELQTLLANQPELQQQIEGKRAASEEERSANLLRLSTDLAGTIGKAVEEFSKVGTIAEQLGNASSSLEGASNELAVFGQQ